MSEKNCEVPGCTNERFKTVPGDLAKKVFTLDEKLTKVHLCKEHYKEYKKGTKKERAMNRMDWD